MKEVEFYFWMLPPPAHKPKGKPHRSSWRMSREDAEKHHPGAVPDLTSREVRMIPETEAEHYQRMEDLSTGMPLPVPRRPLSKE